MLHITLLFKRVSKKESTIIVLFDVYITSKDIGVARITHIALCVTRVMCVKSICKKRHQLT